MQGGVLEEYVLYQPLIDAGIYAVSRLHDVVKWRKSLYHYQCAAFRFAHIDAGHDDGQDGGTIYGVGIFLLLHKPIHEAMQAFLFAYAEKEFAYLLLKENDNRQDAHAEELVEQRSHQSHLKHLGHKEPYDDDGQHAAKDVHGARLAHEAVDVVQQHRHKEDIYCVFYAKVEEHGRIIELTNCRINKLTN